LVHLTRQHLHLRLLPQTLPPLRHPPQIAPRTPQTPPHATCTPPQAIKIAWSPGHNMGSLFPSAISIFQLPHPQFLLYHIRTIPLSMIQIGTRQC
jgi:hypothetical protein